MKSKIYCLFLHKKLDKALICPYICGSFLGLRALSSAERWRQGFFYAFCIFEKCNQKKSSTIDTRTGFFNIKKTYFQPFKSSKSVSFCVKKISL